MKPTIVDQSAGSPYLRQMMLATWLLGICLVLPFTWFAGNFEFTFILASIPDRFLYSSIKTMLLLSFVFALIAKAWWLLAKRSNHAEFLLFGNYYKNLPRPKQLARNRNRAELYCFLVSLAIACTFLLYLGATRWEWRFFDHRGAARMRLSEINLRSVASILENFKLRKDLYPKSMEELINERRIASSILIDGWNNRLVYDPSEDRQHYLLIATNAGGIRTTNWENSQNTGLAFFFDDDYSSDLVVKDGRLQAIYLPPFRD